MQPATFRKVNQQQAKMMGGSVFSGIFFAPRIKDLSRIESNSTQTAVKAAVGLVTCNIRRYDWEFKHKNDKSLGLGILH